VPDGLLERRLGALAPERPSAHGLVEGDGIDAPLGLKLGPVLGRERHPHPASDVCRDLGLQPQHVADVPVIRLGPQMPVPPGIDELSGDPDPVALSDHRALDEGLHPELAGDLRDWLRLVPVLEHRGPRDDPQSAEAGQLGDERIGEPVREVDLLGTTGEVLQGQHRDGRAGTGARPLPRHGSGEPQHAESGEDEKPPPAAREGHSEMAARGGGRGLPR